MRLGTLRIHKHGKRGMGIYFPKWLISALGLGLGSEIDVFVEKGNKVILKPLKMRKK
jgi:antitoxin component of MazEF toxin-antitoxin module